MRYAIAFALAALVSVGASLSYAHNNPGFEREVLAEIAVEAQANDAGEWSAPVTVAPTEHAIQYYYAITTDEDPSAISFSISSGGAVLEADLKDGGRSRVFKEKELVVTDVKGATKPFTITVTVEDLVRTR